MITKCTRKLIPQISISWLFVMVTAKMLFSLLLWQLSLRVGNPYSFTQNQNINLINSPNFKSIWLLFLEIKCCKVSLPHWLLRPLDIAMRAKNFESNQNWVLMILLYFLKLCWKSLNKLNIILYIDSNINSKFCILSIWNSLKINNLSKIWFIWNIIYSGFTHAISNEQIIR